MDLFLKLNSTDFEDLVIFSNKEMCATAFPKFLLHTERIHGCLVLGISRVVGHPSSFLLWRESPWLNFIHELYLRECWRHSEGLISLARLATWRYATNRYTLLQFRHSSTCESSVQQSKTLTRYKIGLPLHFSFLCAKRNGARFKVNKFTCTDIKYVWFAHFYSSACVKKSRNERKNHQVLKIGTI